ncbi:FAD-dependent oxidoreductase, partial [Candidatus Bipolaricaulota bacterium]|nr:FAD-dependent oxidoreductase [Candidatus Bipolaricaulota bacterium]
MKRSVDVIVVGAGHAGCEAALISARSGMETVLLNIDLDKTAKLSCNPAIGGPGKTQLVREIDALGGEMAKNTDRSVLHMRRL